MNGKNTVTEKIQNNRLISKYTSKKGIIGILYKIVRAVIVIGICFMIIYPFLMKFIVAFMSETDLYDPTVRSLPRHFSLENIQYSEDQKYTSMILLNAIETALKKAENN